MLPLVGGRANSPALMPSSQLTYTYISRARAIVLSSQGVGPTLSIAPAFEGLGQLSHSTTLRAGSRAPPPTGPALLGCPAAGPALPSAAAGEGQDQLTHIMTPRLVLPTATSDVGEGGERSKYTPAVLPFGLTHLHPLNQGPAEA